MGIKHACLLTIGLLLGNWLPAEAQFVIDGSVFTNYGRINYYGPYTEVTSTAGSLYEADFGSNFDHYETDPISLRINNSYNANGPEGGSSDNFLGPSGLPGPQGVGGNIAPNFYNLVLDNGAESVFAITNIAGAKIFESVDFKNGITTTVRANRRAGALHFQIGASFKGGLSDKQHVNGYVSKLGNDAFTFPVGSGSDARPLSIGEPASVAAVIATAYETNNVENAVSVSSPITSVFERASWDWIVGSANDDDGLAVSVSIPNVSDFAPASELRLIGWNGTQWINIGGSSGSSGNQEGSILSGVIPTGVNITQIGIGAMQGSLPVTLASFTVAAERNTASLDWSTTNEINNEYFEIERSPDARSWELLGRVKSHRESNDIQFYNFKDQHPIDGINYYRLKMTDRDGSFAFSDIRLVKFDLDLDIVFLPNPTPGKLYLRSNNLKSLDHIQLINPLGKILYDKKKQNNGADFDSLDLSDLSSGIYFVIVTSESGEITNHKIIRE